MATVYQVSPVHAYLLVALQRVRTLMSSIMPSMQNGRTVPGSGQRYWLGRAEETSDPVAFGSIQQRNRFIVAENPVGPGTESSDHGYYLMSNSSSSMDVPGNTTEDFDTWDAWIECTKSGQSCQRFRFWKPGTGHSSLSFRHGCRFNSRGLVANGNDPWIHGLPLDGIKYGCH
ncbi:hypothetical protein CPB86DRAFT_348307 [Serendipita vermifera]|nr:hypothetical protein CPB86DRAFT_348307 [Serendipita vermifera]